MRVLFGPLEKEVSTSGESAKRSSDSVDEAGDLGMESADEAPEMVPGSDDENRRTGSSEPSSSSFGGSSDDKNGGPWTSLTSKIEEGSGGTPRKKLYNAKTDTIIKIETLPDSRAKTVAGLLNFAIIIGSAAVVALSVLKMQRMDKYVLGEALMAWNLGVALFDMTILGAALSFISWRIHLVNKAKKQWSQKRKVATILFVVELVTQFINSIFFFAPNLYLLRNPCGWHDTFIHWCGFMRFTCWNVLFLTSAVFADNVTPDYKTQNDPNGRPDAIIMERPLSYHKWKLIPWWVNVIPIWGLCIFEVIVMWLSLYTSNLLSFNRLPAPPEGLTDTCTGRAFTCTIGIDIKALTIGIGLICMWYLIYYAVKTYQALKDLQSKSYLQNRMANITQRLRARLRIVSYTFITVSMSILWYYRMESCASYALSWLGFLPMQFVMSILMVLWTFIQHPIKPTKDFVLSTWLQEFSWCEEKLEKKKDEMDKLMCSRSHHMFCFESAMKLYYWSELVYDYRETEKTEFTLETAMDLYGLTNYELFSEPLHDTKVLLAWSDKYVLLAFRGTKTLKNVVADLKWFRKPHPPKRNSFWSRPMVHGGFLDSWQSNDLNKRIIEKMKEVIGEWKGRDMSPRVLVTGHSLGGALASLAALDIARYVGVPKCSIRCYTFGAPRTGNHAFARDYNSYVPDTWHVINDQDYITRALKFISMYKRHGHRTIINSRGDIIVKPSFLEINVLKRWGHVNMAHHLLSSYRRSLRAVVQAQFVNDKQLEGGMGAVLDLLNPKSAGHMSRVLGVDKPSLLRINQFGDRISKLNAAKRRVQRREKWRKAALGVMDRTSSFAKSFATSVSGLKPLNKQILCDKMCPMTTMACGREVGNDLCSARKRSRSLCLEGGFMCPFSHMCHVTFDGLPANYGNRESPMDTQFSGDHKIVIYEDAPRSLEIQGTEG